ncbi:MAG: amidohydrolase [Desulfovibrio sp.]|jgi:5-methylthioadenosine/S-adenosylhomocysteine deaminase|nr:amidohydrolase [Desulfovibrio sp.]
MGDAAKYDCDLLISADYLIASASPAAGISGHRIIEDAALAVSGGRVIAVGTRTGSADRKAKRRLDLGRSLILPGLVNAHTHIAMTFLRGSADDLPLKEWLTRCIFPRERRLTPEIVELGALIGCAELIRTGCTAFADMYLFEDAVAAAVDRAGLRCLMGEAVFGFPTPASASAEQAFDKVRGQAERFRGHSRLRVAVMPHTVYTTGEKILRSCLDLADELGLPLHLHVAETAGEAEDCRKAHGKGPVAYCRDLGLLRPTTTLIHCVVPDEDELDMIAASGAQVVHNPRSNMKLASGVAPVPAMLRRGILPGLGTDGAASNNALNMFAEMSACALLHKGYSRDPTVCPAAAVLDMATTGSAAALSWPGLGRIFPGGPADLVALDLHSPNFLPLYNPFSHIVYAASGFEVRLSMAEGRILYEDGVFKTLDFPELCREAEKLKQWVSEKC